MAWKVEFHRDAAKELGSLDRQVQERTLRFLRDRIATQHNPRRLGKALKGPGANLWRYRVGDYRIVSHIDDAERTVSVPRIGHRRSVYR